MPSATQTTGSRTYFTASISGHRAASPAWPIRLKIPPPASIGTNGAAGVNVAAAVVSNAVPMMLGTKAMAIPAPRAHSPMAIFWNAMPAMPAMAMIMPTILPRLPLA